MELYKGTGTNPFARCLPILLQSPFFFALFRVLNGSGRSPTHGKTRSGRSRQPLAAQADQSTIFGAQLSASSCGADDVTVKIVTVILIVADVGDDVHHAAPADEEEHAGGRAGQPVREAAEDPALRLAAVLRDLRHQLPDRRAALLADHEPLVDGPAVLRDPPDAGAGLPGREGPRGAPEKSGKSTRSSRPRDCTTRTRPTTCRTPSRSPPSRCGPAPAAQAQEAQPSGAAERPMPATKPVVKPGPPAPASARRPVADTTAARRDAEPAARPAARAVARPSTGGASPQTPSVPRADRRVRHPVSEETLMTDQDSTTVADQPDRPPAGPVRAASRSRAARPAEAARPPEQAEPSEPRTRERGGAAATTTRRAGEEAPGRPAAPPPVRLEGDDAEARARWRDVAGGPPGARGRGRGGLPRAAARHRRPRRRHRRRRGW